jgi:dihydroorotate dehydrogenase (NAD+) catalytic subunit
MVWQVAGAVDIPVVGMGGVMTAEDAVEFLIAGATCVAVGTGNFVDPTTTIRVLDGMEEWCHANGVASVRELIGSLEVGA